MPLGFIRLMRFIGDNNFSVQSAEGQHFEVEPTASSVPIKFNDRLLTTWKAEGQVFTEHGNDITNKNVQTYLKRFWALGDKPATSPNGQIKQVGRQPDIWQVDWTDSLPLTLNSTYITYLDTTVRLEAKNKKQNKIRPDIKVIYQKNCYIEGEPIELTVPMHSGSASQLKLNEETFPVVNGSVYIERLAEGNYQSELIAKTSSVLLPEFKVMPAVTWEFPKEKRLVEGKTYAATLRCQDGRFQRFRFKPRLNELGEALPTRHSVTLDNDIAVSFELVCKAYAVRLVDQDKRVLNKLSGAQLKRASLQVINPYSRDIPLRLRLSSDAERTYEIQELTTLSPAASDALIIEACLDQRSQNWMLVHNLPVTCSPEIKALSIIDDKLECRIEGCGDTFIRIEEFNPTVQRIVNNTYKLPSGQRNIFPLKHPHRFSSVHVRAFFSFGSTAEEVLIQEFVTEPFSSPAKQLKRGIGWSKARHKTVTT